MANCLKCEKLKNCPWSSDPEVICSAYQQKPMSNADRIRAMTDEELAKFLEMDRDCYRCSLKCIGHDGKPLSRAACMLKVREWLKEEAEE